VAFEPTLNQEDTFTRKGNKAIKGLMIYYDADEMGWSCSVHDNRISSNNNLYLSLNIYFNNRE